MGKKCSVKIILKERKCPICGKIFIIQDPKQYAYKRGYEHTPKIFCSWTCLRKYDKMHPPSKKLNLEF